MIESGLFEKEWDVDAGDPVLDYVNSVEWRQSARPVDQFKTYADVVSWAIATGVIGLKSGKLMKDFADKNPRKAKQSFQKILRLRESLARIFSSIAYGNSVEKSDLDQLNARILEAHRGSKLESSPSGIQWGWGIEEHHLDLILWSVALQAATLLTSENIERIGECEDDRGCGYLFLDESKNNSRRWCTMQSCGNRAKARRHYQKQAKKQNEVKDTV